MDRMSGLMSFYLWTDRQRQSVAVMENAESQIGGLIPERPFPRWNKDGVNEGNGHFNPQVLSFFLHSLNCIALNVIHITACVHSYNAHPPVSANSSCLIEDLSWQWKAVLEYGRVMRDVFTLYLSPRTNCSFLVHL